MSRPTKVDVDPAQVPEEVVRAAVCSDYERRDGKLQRTFVLYTVAGIRTRTLVRSPGENQGWWWERSYEGERMPWSKPFPYIDPDTPESVFQFQQRLEDPPTPIECRKVPGAR